MQIKFYDAGGHSGELPHDDSKPGKVVTFVKGDARLTELLNDEYPLETLRSPFGKPKNE